MICKHCTKETGNNNPACGTMKDKKSCTYRVYMNEYNRNYRKGILKPKVNTGFNRKDGDAGRKARRREELIRLGYCMIGDDSWLMG